jgi:hypothetical protein
MADGPKMQAERAMLLANAILGRLAPAAQRIAIAGSLRRRNQWVSDIELVAIPKIEPDPAAGLFSPPTSALDRVLNQCVADQKLMPIKNGDRYKQFFILTATGKPKLDLFVGNPDNWGYLLAIRTGPADYSRHIVTQRAKGGAMRDDILCRGGFVWRAVAPNEAPPGPSTATVIDGVVHVLVPVPEESDFFALVDGGYVEPEKRRYH